MDPRNFIKLFHHHLTTHTLQSCLWHHALGAVCVCEWLMKSQHLSLQSIQSTLHPSFKQTDPRSKKSIII